MTNWILHSNYKLNESKTRFVCVIKKHRDKNSITVTYNLNIIELMCMLNSINIYFLEKRYHKTITELYL